MITKVFLWTHFRACSLICDIISLGSRDETIVPHSTLVCNLCPRVDFNGINAGNSLKFARSEKQNMFHLYSASNYHVLHNQVPFRRKLSELGTSLLLTAVFLCGVSSFVSRKHFPFSDRASFRCSLYSVMWKYFELILQISERHDKLNVCYLLIIIGRKATNLHIIL